MNEDFHLFVDTLKAKYPDVSLHVSLAGAGHIVVHDIVVADNLRNNGIGTMIMEEICHYCDANQMTVALSPSTDRGARMNEKRLIAFYEQFGFTKNLGKKRDFTISETFRREPLPIVLDDLDDLQIGDPAPQTIAQSLEL